MFNITNQDGTKFSRYSWKQIFTDNIGEVRSTDTQYPLKCTPIPSNGTVDHVMPLDLRSVLSSDGTRSG